VDGLGLLGSSPTQAQDRVGHEGQRDHGEDENQEQRAISPLRPPWLLRPTSALAPGSSATQDFTEPGPDLAAGRKEAVRGRRI
jgi:hypothetical protein